MAMLTKCFLNSIQGNNLMADQPIRAQDEKYCSSCGAVIKKEAEICPKCGVRQSFAGYSEEISDKGADFLPKAVSCCVPLVSVVLYFVWKDSKPELYPNWWTHLLPKYFYSWRVCSCPRKQERNMMLPLNGRRSA